MIIRLFGARLKRTSFIELQPTLQPEILDSPPLYQLEFLPSINTLTKA